MFKLTPLIFVFILTVANCQFFYNYEEDQSDEPQTVSQNSGSNLPTAANDQFIQPRRSNLEPENNSGYRRTRIRVRSRGSPPESADPQLTSAAEPETDDRAARQSRRQARRRDRQNSFIAPVTPARVYSPSLFENIGFGEAPSGVYIPPDSFLNVLRNPSRRTQSSYPLSQPQAAIPPATNYVQPSVSYVDTEPQQRFFVQPPTSDEPRQPNLILPVTRPGNQQVISTVPQTPSTNSNRATTQARAVGRNRQANPVVDIDSFRPAVDEFDRENVMSRVQYVPVTVRRNIRPQNRQRTVTSYQLTTTAPRVYSPSIFEKIPLGEAPNGIYVPEDSLLNVLRNPSSGQYSTPRVSRQRVPQALPQIQSYAAPQDYEDEIIEEQYQPPPPPPPPASRRPSSQRSRQVQSTRRTQPTVQVVQPSTERRNQRRNEEFEDYERQRPPVQQRTQSNRRQSVNSAPAPVAVPATRSRSQASTADRGDTNFKKANLKIAELPQDSDDDGIPGEAGKDYPTFHVIPKTSFSCAQQAHNGYYADLETSCQVVHMCQSGGVKSSFLCPNGTIFNQEKFSCQWWYKVNCNDAPNFYIKNDELYKVPEKKERRRN